MWELNFFVKHFLEAYRGVALTPAVRAALDEECADASPTSSRASRACSAIATITAAI